MIKEKDMSAPRRYNGNRYSRICAVGLAVAFGIALGPVPAAADCGSTTRQQTAKSNEIHINNKTKSDLTVTFYRDTTNEDKGTETITPGNSADFSAGLSGTGSATAIAVVDAQGAYAKTTCSIKVSNFEKGSFNYKSRYEGSTCSTSDNGSEYDLSCDRSYNKGKDRWKTLWTFSESN
jgi:hypothetical protein